MKINMLVSCDKTTGLGHIYRSIGLAKTLQKRGHYVTIVPSSVTGHAIAKNLTDIMTILWPGEELPDSDWSIVDQVGASRVLGKEKTCFLGATGSKQVDGPYIDDYDLVICGGIPFDATSVTDKWLVGFEYVLLWPGLKEYVRTRRVSQVFLYTSVYKGVVEKLASRLRKEFDVVPAEQITNPQRLDPYLASSAVAVMPFGMTTIESMYLGVPSVSFNMNQYATGSAVFAHQTGAIKLLDPSDAKFIDKVIINVSLLMDDFQHHTSTDYAGMKQKGMCLVDGHGCERVADKIEELK